MLFQKICKAIEKIEVIGKRFFYRNFLGIKLGKNVFIGKNVRLRRINGGNITIGDNCEIRDFVQMTTYGGDIKIGNNCSLNYFCVLYGTGGLKIGDDVRIATHTVMVPANHSFSDLSKPIRLQPVKKSGIIINNDVWIGASCQILDGVIIEEGSIIGAGSVVNKKVEKYSVYAGVPAKFIKKRE